MNDKPSCTRNEPFKGIKGEELQVGTKYSFSFSPADTPHAPEVNDEKFLLFYGQTYRYFKELKYSNYELWIEASPKGRLHFHGTVNIPNDVLNFLIHDLPLLQKMGTYEIDTINDSEKWNEYITKQFDLWKPVMSRNIYGYPMKTVSDIGVYRIKSRKKLGMLENGVIEEREKIS